MLPKWEIGREEFLKRLELSESSLVKQLRFPIFFGFQKVVPLRDIRKIGTVIPASNEAATHILERVRTADGERSFASSNFKLCKFDPAQLKIGQRYVYREKYQELIEKLPHVLTGFMIPRGVRNLGIHFMFGEDWNGESVMAIYFPPIVEEEGNRLVVMDGIHRSYIAHQFGATTTGILVRNVAVPFPCELHSWSVVKVVSVKDRPKDLKERFFGLREGLLRDLKYLGIDG